MLVFMPLNLVCQCIEKSNTKKYMHVGSSMPDDGHNIELEDSQSLMIMIFKLPESGNTRLVTRDNDVQSELNLLK